MNSLSNNIIYIETEVQGMLFVRASICGEYLPSIPSIHFLLDKVKDKRNKRNFTEYANETAIVLANKYYLPLHLFDGETYRAWHKQIDWEQISYPDLNKVLTKNIALWCDLNGCSFSKVIKSLFVINWFGDLQDNVHLDWAKYRASLKYYLSDSLGIADKLIKPEYTFSKSSNVDCSEYIDAETFYSNFLTKCEPIEGNLDFNRQASGLQILTLRAMRKEAEFDKSLYRLCICEGCRQKWFPIQKGSVSNLCSSCQQKQKLNSRKKDRKGWIEDRVGACEGGCGSPKLKINTSGSCLKCYLRDV